MNKEKVSNELFIKNDKSITLFIEKKHRIYHP